MKNTINIYIITILIFMTSLSAFSQKAFFSGPVATVNVNDSVVIRLNDYEGTIQWQKSLNLDIWEFIPGATQDTLFFLADTTSYFRAEVIAGDCDPFYSDTTMVGVFHITTMQVTDITINSARSGGNVISDGGTPVIARGVVWSTSTNPTTDNNDGYTTDGTGIGEFTSNITSLTPETQYYVRAYATNSAGTGYGQQEEFSTLASTPDTYTLTLQVSPESSGEVSGAGEYAAGTTVIITATPNENYQFINWSGDTEHIADANAANTTLTIPAQNISLTANFDEDGGGNGDDTEVVEVINPATGRTWMDRNLGASRAATSSTDAEAYGDLYQWGRAADGHQKRTSGTTSTLSNSDTPGHGDFITVGLSPWDWRSPKNDNLWQGVNGINNPCPAGYRLPTEAELNAERQSWSSNNAAGAFASPLKLPMPGHRDYGWGMLNSVGSIGSYWSSSVSGVDSPSLYFTGFGAVVDNYSRAGGISVRCIKDF